MKKRHFDAFVILLVITIVLGCNKKEKQQMQSTIAVFGTGTVLVQPDMVQMTITISKVAETTKMAQEEVSKMVKQALTVLRGENIEAKNISTASLTFSSEYEYGVRRVLIGQKAEQSIIFSINDINNDNEKISRIIDLLIQINGIELNQINFGVKNNTEYFIKSRELAFQKAAEKANQYAELSNLKISRVLSISEEGNQQVLPINNRFMNQMAYDQEAALSNAGSTIVSSGELEITTKILIEFLLK